MTRTHIWQGDSAAAWNGAVGHRFVDELLAGTLDDAVLAGYLVQDYQFCDAFTALLGQACASAPALPSRLRFAKQLGMFAADEDTYFVDTFDELGVSETDRVAPALTPATRAFDRVMRDALEARSYAACLAVLYVAEGLYLDWGERADREPIGDLERKHLGWIDLHRGPAFTAWVHWLRDELDGLDIDAAEESAARGLFRRAVACELAFFDAAYAG